MKFSKFIEECSEKEVFKKLSIYIVSSWVLIQVVDVTSEHLGLPERSVTYLIILLLIGLQINFYLIWKYHLKKLEKKKNKLDKSGNPIPNKYKKSAFQKMYYSSMTVVIMFTTFIIALIINNNFIGGPSKTKIDVTEKIAVLKFNNNTGDPEFDIVGKMTADWIMHGITENKVGQVISPVAIEDHAEYLINSASLAPLETRTLLKEYFNPRMIISGNFFLKKGKLLFHGSITEGAEERVLISFKPIDCDADDPLDCIEKLKQLILGFIATEKHNEGANWEELPPMFEAYQLVLNATTFGDTDKRFIEFIDKAIEIDPNYFEPKVLRIEYYYNLGDYKKADSLVQKIEPNMNTSQRQRNIIDLYTALLLGDNGKIFKYLRKEYKLASFEVSTNASMMIIAQQFVNRPTAIDSIYKEINMDKFDPENCAECLYRYLMRAMSMLELGQYEEILKLSDSIGQKIVTDFIREPLLAANIRLGNDKEALRIFAEIDELNNKEEWRKTCILIGNEYLLKNDKKNADLYFNRLIDSYDENIKNIDIAFALYSIMKLEEAKLMYEELLIADPEDLIILGSLGKVYAGSGNLVRSNQIIEKLLSMRSDFQFGDIDYYIAQIYAVQKETENMLRHLKRSVADGKHFTIYTYNNDPDFLDYHKTDAFKDILNYWN